MKNRICPYCLQEIQIEKSEYDNLLAYDTNGNIHDCQKILLDCYEQIQFIQNALNEHIPYITFIYREDDYAYLEPIKGELVALDHYYLIVRSLSNNKNASYRLEHIEQMDCAESIEEMEIQFEELKDMVHLKDYYIRDVEDETFEMFCQFERFFTKESILKNQSGLYENEDNYFALAIHLYERIKKNALDHLQLICLQTQEAFWIKDILNPSVLKEIEQSGVLEMIKEL